MTKLYFINPGQLDIRALITQGVSAKIGSVPIGKFGTGAKYAIAGILRLGGRISIRSGAWEYMFFPTDIEIRNKTFEIVNCVTKGPGMNVESELGFTTSLGAHWEPWMLYRELRANTLDEAGCVLTAKEIDIFNWHENGYDEDEMTVIEVVCDEITAAHENLAEHWLLADVPVLWQSPILQVCPGHTKSLFYRGMKCGEWPVECAYTYNFLSGIGLTEDRSCDNMYMAKLLLGRELMKWDASDTTPIEHMLRSDVHTISYERSELDWDWSNDGSASREFLAVVAKLRKAGNLRNDKSWTKIGRGYAYAREEFLPVASPPTEAEQLAIALACEATQVLGLPWEGKIHVSQDWEERDWEGHEVIDGELYISHWLLQRPGSWLVAKLVNITLLRDSSLTYKHRAMWAFEQLLVAKGLGAMLPLPADVTQDEMPF